MYSWLCVIASIAVTGVIAFAHTYLPKALFPFYFSPIILRYQPFLFDGMYHYYFIFVAIVIGVGIVLARVFLYKASNVVLGVALFMVLVIQSPFLGVYMMLVSVGLYYLRGRDLNCFFIKFFLYFGVWFVVCVGIPWMGVLLYPNLDFLRVIFLSVFSIRVALFLYDRELKNYRPSLKETMLYFMFPVHFFITPSWIVCPFPSDFVEKRDDSNVLFQYGAVKLLEGCVYLGGVIFVGVLFNFFMGVYPTQALSQRVPLPFIQKYSVTLLLSILKIMYFFFISDALIGFYAIFGYKMSLPVFNRPFFSKNIFDFWNRFLIQTKHVILTLFVIPIFNTIKPCIPQAKIRLFVSVVIGLFIVDIPIHMVVIFDRNTAFINNAFIVKWYVSLIGLFSFYLVWRTMVPKKIQLYSSTPFGRVSQMIFWVTVMCFFY